MSQSHDVENRLREMILDMEIGPGERITERWAETCLGASRTPIRAALLRLENEGLVRRDGRGWMVAPLDLNELEQLFEYREVLEAAALRLAVGRENAEALDELAEQLEVSRKSKSKDAAQAFGTAFHIKLAELAGNEFISRGVTDAMRRLSRARWLDTEVEHEGWDEHRAILAALREGDADLAAALVQKHIRASRARLVKVMQGNRRSFRARGLTVVN